MTPKWKVKKKKKTGVGRQKCFTFELLQSLQFLWVGHRTGCTRCCPDFWTHCSCSSAQLFGTNSLCKNWRLTNRIVLTQIFMYLIVKTEQRLRGKGRENDVLLYRLHFAEFILLLMNYFGMALLLVSLEKAVWNLEVARVSFHLCPSVHRERYGGSWLREHQCCRYDPLGQGTDR